MRSLILTITLVAASAAAGAQTVVPTQPNPNPCSVASLGVDGALNGLQIFGGDIWHQDITTAAIDPYSSTYVNGGTWNGVSVPAHGADSLHPDFGTAYGIPYNVVDGTDSKFQTMGKWVTNNYPPPDSDDTLWPVPTYTPAIEGNPAVTSGTDPNENPYDDNHLLILDRANCVLYESWLTQPQADGRIWYNNGVIWDLTLSSQNRYQGGTSADAGGFSILEGLIRYDEVASGVISHAIRYTMPDTSSGYFVAPATHASQNGGSSYTGMRMRLHANFDISGFSAANQVILTAMKKYGIILADGGSPLYVSGTNDSRWNDTDVANLGNVHLSDFDVVQMGTQYSVNVAPGTPPSGTITASTTKVAAGMPVTLSVTATGDKNYIDHAGFVRSGSSITVYPTATTTYTLYSSNSYQGHHVGPTSSVTVEVNPSSATFTPGNVQVLANTNIPLSITCIYPDGSVLPCPGSFYTDLGTISGSNLNAPTGTATVTTTYQGITLTNTLTIVPLPSLFGGSNAISGKN